MMLAIVIVFPKDVSIPIDFPDQASFTPTWPWAFGSFTRPKKITVGQKTCIGTGRQISRPLMQYLTVQTDKINTHPKERSNNCNTGCRHSINGVDQTNIRVVSYDHVRSWM